MQIRTVVFSLVAVFSLCANAEEAFHEPATPVEKRLDAILKRTDSDQKQLDNLLQRYAVEKADRVDYSTMLTKRLIAQLRSQEKMHVNQACGGHYRDGEICGIDYSPITCAQDFNDTYLYRTINQTASTAHIEYRWPSSVYRREGANAAYTLHKAHGSWKIDVIECKL